MIKSWTVGPLILAVGLSGLWKLARRSSFRLRQATASILELWRRLQGADRFAAAVTLMALATLSLHIMIGGLAPDCSQDAIWYHLSVPGQWAITGEAGMYTHVLQSTFTLAIEAVYAGLLLYFDEIMCSSLYAMTLVIALWLWVLISYLAVGVRPALLVAALIPFLLATNIAIAPIFAGNDVFVLVCLMLTLCALIKPLETGAAPTFGESTLIGTLLGFATVCKIVALVFWPPLLCAYFCYLMLLKGKWRDGSLALLGVSLSILVMFAPWLVRAFAYCGNPLIIISQSIFPLHEEYLPVLRGYDLEPRFYSLNIEGLKQAMAHGIPIKLNLLQSEKNCLYLLAPLAAAICLFFRQAKWRIQSLGILCCFASLIILRGRNELLRYFALFFGLAVMLMARMCQLLEQKLKQGVITVLLLLFLTASSATYFSRQILWGNYSTINWPYRPVLTAEDRLEWAGKTENGWLYLGCQAIQPFLPQDATVLLADIHGSYYLKRKAVWGGYSSGSPQLDWWREFTTEEILHDLVKRKIDHVLYANKASIDPRIQTLAEEGKLLPIELDNAPGSCLEQWRLWRVNPASTPPLQQSAK